MGYLNGAGSVLLSDQDYSGARPDVTQEEATDMEYLQQALIPMSSETHSGEDVAVYAKGPFAHLFDGTVEQNYIFHVMHHAVNAEATAAAEGGATGSEDTATEAAAEDPVTAEDVLPIADEAEEDATESIAGEGEDAEGGEEAPDAAEGGAATTEGAEDAPDAATE